MAKETLAVIIGNRGCFPGYLAENGRMQVLNLLKNRGIAPVIVGKEETRFGAIESLNEAKKCASLFQKNREKISGILISLPNFGDERAIAETIKMSELNVPVLIQARPDELKKMSADDRGDSFCGKLSVCNVLRQYGIRFSLTASHTVAVDSKAFSQDLDRFLAVCRVVNGLRRARIGAIGARTTPFKTVRYSEKLLEAAGISVETLDLSEIVTAVEKMKDSDRAVKAKLKQITAYCSTRGVPPEPLLRMAKMGAAVDRWAKANELDACTIQCWTALQDALRIFPCTLMSIMSESLLPTACEVDVMGALAMYALQLASGKPSGLFDWNNNYGSDPDKTVLFHCSNAPKSMLVCACMEYNAITSKMGAGPENSYGTCAGRLKKGPMTFARLSTDDLAGEIIGCVGEGELTDDPLDSFGGIGVAKIEDLQELMRFLCRNGFEHHVAVSQSQVASILFEALTEYLDFEIFRHRG